MRVSNYERVREEWRRRFLSMDPDDICRRLPEIKKTEHRLLLQHYGRRLAVDRLTGTIEAVSDSRPVGFTSEMNVYTLLWYAKKDAALTNEWLPFGELKGAAPFSSAFQKGIVESLAATFSGHEGSLEEAVKCLGGSCLSPGRYLLHAFSCIPVKLNFWDADDEFPAQANLLFDRSATDFNHVESVVSIAQEALNQLADKAGLPIKGSPFSRL